MANQEFSGFIHDDAGVAIASATVELFDRNTTTPVRASTTSNSSGYWTISHATEGRFDVKISKGTFVRWIMYDDEGQMESLEVKNLHVRGSDNAFDGKIAGPAFTADRTLTLPDFSNEFHVGIIKRKAADQSVTSSTTPVADDTLLFAVGANETWTATLDLLINAGTTPDIKFDFEGLPSGLTGSFMVIDTSSEVQTSNALGSTLEVPGTGADDIVRIVVVVRSSSTAGNVTLYWAQGTSDAGAAKVLADSVLVAHRLA
jgi:hypothetical protein